jgi:hypothetical protein
MTTFKENPYAKARNIVNRLISKNNLDKTLDSKFKHKKFSERFAPANTAFLSMGLVAQISSMITAFVMLSYLFVNTPVLIRVIVSVTLLVAIEVIKRLSTNDVMQGIFQYKSVEPFAAILGIATLTASIYIAVEGAKILPTLLVYDAVQEQAKQQTPDAINTDYDNRISALIAEREQHRKERTWKDRLASKDAKIIKQHNENIQALQVQKDSALAELKTENKAARTTAFHVFEEHSDQVKVERADLGKQLVIAAVGFELLFVISMCFSWWYYTECEKERQELKKLKETAEMPIGSGNTAEVKPDTSEVKEEVLVYEEVGPRAKKMSFKDYETSPPPQEEVIRKTPPEVEKIKKDYTRICPECNTPFVHNSHNHTYCQRSCAVAARDKEKRQAEKERK